MFDCSIKAMAFSLEYSLMEIVIPQYSKVHRFVTNLIRIFKVMLQAKVTREKEIRKYPGKYDLFS